MRRVAQGCPAAHGRKKLAGTLAGEKNRLHKVLDDAGIKLGEVVSDINGVSARAMIFIEIGGNPAQFGSADRLASWAALCPGKHESAGKRKSGRTRHGNPMVRYLLCEAAHAACRSTSAFKARYESLVIWRGSRPFYLLLRKLARELMASPHHS